MEDTTTSGGQNKDKAPNKAETVHVSSQSGGTMDVQNGDSGESQHPPRHSSEISGVTEATVKTPPGTPARPARKEGQFMDVVAAAVTASGGRDGSFDSAATAATIASKPTIFHHNQGFVSPPKKDFMSLVTAAAAAAARVESSEQSLVAAKTTTPAMDAVADAAQPNTSSANPAAAPAAAAAATHPILQKEGSLASNKTKQHNRKISWGSTSNVMRGSSSFRASLSSSLSTTGKTKRITDLMKQVNPLEQEAETLIISSIEDMEAMDKSRGEDNKPQILEFVPQGAEGVFSDFANATKRSRSASTCSNDKPAAGDAPNVGQQSRQTERPSERPTHRRNKTTVEEDLVSLGNALQALSRPVNLPSNSAQNQYSPAPEENMQAGGSADRLAANAALLFQRRRSTKVLVDVDGEMVSPPLSAFGQTSDTATTGIASGRCDEAAAVRPTPTTTTTASPPRTVKSHWKKLNTAVFLSQSLNNKKKTDEEQEGGGPSGTMSGGGGGGGDDDQQQQQPGDSFDMEIGGAAGTQTNDSAGGSPTSTKRQKKEKAIMSFLQGRFVMVSEYTNEQRYTSVAFFLLVVVLVVIACILFYFVGNPPTGIITFTYAPNGTIIDQSPVVIDPTQASTSWWFLFAARQLLTFALTIASEFIVIDYFCLRLRWINFFRSPLLTLLFVQSRGWPFRATTWGIYDLLMLQGDNRFAGHWMYYQLLLRVFNESNPSGNFTSNTIYTRVLSLLVGIGLTTSCKRVYVGFMQGKRVFATYGEEVASLMRKVLLISQVGILARDIEMKGMLDRHEDEERSIEDNIWKKVEQICDEDASKATGLDDPLLEGSFSQSHQMQIIELLGDWEDPEAVPEHGVAPVERNISVTSILQFRQSLEFFDVPDMFGYYFGPTDTRAHCVESSEQVYNRLLLRSNREDALSFHVLAMLALHADGTTLKNQKVKELIHMFRPDRDGALSVLDFVKSVDDVYKKMKLLRATIKKTQRLDEAVEKIFNIGYYFVIGAISLAVLGIDPMALFISLSSIIVAFAFMIGSASAKYFEGLLFILVRKPFGVGDRVFFNPPEDETSTNGSAGWFVRDITLYHTTLVFGSTNECCTISNGSLANLRVINAARSPKAVLYIFLKFGTEVPWAKIQIFENSLREFVKSRPREWLGVNGFRTTRVETDLGFHEMVVVLQHRDSWQNVVALLVSKAEVAAFCHELQKKMDMKYKSPPLPVDLTLNQSSSLLGVAVNDKDVGQAVVAKLGGPSAPGSGSDFDAVAQLFGKDG